MAPKAKAKGKGKSNANAKANAAAAAPQVSPQLVGKSDSLKKGASAAGAPSPTGPSVEELFKTLDRNVKADDFKAIVKVADQILKLSSGDRDAVDCKVQAIIQLDDYDQALSVIDSYPGVDLTFHKAYCLYKRNRAEEALAALENVEKDAKVLQLEAQILFKLGDFSSCISRYQELLDSNKNVSDEVKSNLIAAYVSAGRSEEVADAMEAMKVTAKSDFNLAYNAGCAFIERGEFTKAEENLYLARRIGQETLIEDEYPEDEIEDELVPISVQLAYVRQAQGQSAEALEAYNAVVKRKPADESSMAIASNNLIALRGAKGFDALKKFDKLFDKGAGGKLQLTDKLEQRLSASQKEALHFNRFLLLLHSNKLDQARSLLPLLSELYPDSEIPPMLAASLALREGKPARAEDGLEEFAAKYSKSSTPVRLIQAQVAATVGNFGKAANWLEKIEKLQHRSGMVATLVALRDRSGDVDKAEAILDEAVSWWDNHMDDDTSFSEQVIQEAAAYKLNHNKLQAAAELFQRLLKSSSPTVRVEALNGLVSSTALSDPSRAEVFEKQLPPLPGLKSVDKEALERVAPTTSKRARAADEDAKTGDERVDKNKPKKKRKKKPLYPKNFDPANPGPPPDPERWLPKRERSSFKPKRKDKRALQQQIRGAQGSVSRDKGADTAANGPAGSSKTATVSQKSSAPTVTAESSKPTTSSSKHKKKGRK